MKKDVLASVHEINNDFKLQYVVDSKKHLLKPRLIDYYNNQNYYIIQPINEVYYEIYIEFIVCQQCFVDLVYIHNNENKIQQTKPFSSGIQQFYIKTIKQDAITNEMYFLQHLFLKPYTKDGKVGNTLLTFTNYKIKE